jgi:mono/diheme cytochrome c family protein
MNIRAAFGLLVVGMLALPPSRAGAQVVDTTRKGSEPDPALLTPAMIEAGRKIFHGQGNCYACHGEKLQGGPIAPPLTGKAWRHISGTFDAIVDRIDNGLANTLMVPHPGGISESQIFLVATYVYTMSHGPPKP